MNTTRIICAGFGGQGIMLLGKLIAEAAMRDNKNVTWIPSYGAEVRGGTAHSMVVISDDEIPSPVVGETDICLIMNKPSLDKFQNRLKKHGTLILNSSLIETSPKGNDINVIKIPATEIALSLGNVKSANIAMFGAFLKVTKLIKEKSATDLLKELFGKKQDLYEVNKKALYKGFETAPYLRMGNRYHTRKCVEEL